MTLLINSDRFKKDFDELATHGGTANGGVNRVALSDPHLRARQWLINRAQLAGLETQVDGAGNVSAVLKSPTSTRSVQTLLLGSHTDSVPNGGRYDGALGVLAALEVLRTIKESGISLPFNLELIDFTDEEGTHLGLLGSKAIAGSLTAESLQNSRGGRQRLVESLQRGGLTEESVLQSKRDFKSIAGYLELHIEQGPRLTQSAIKIGVVTGIVGIASYKMKYMGVANHAGTTPMDARSDAGLAASAFTLTAREMVMRDFTNCVVNVGQMNFLPSAFNIIPGLAEFSLEFRSPDTEQLIQLEAALLGLANVIGRQFRVTLEYESAGGCVPAPMSVRVQAAIVAAADSLALSHMAMPSGAGHDAQSLAPYTDAGMIFIPSRDGISHSPLEFSEWDDCVHGANVLLRAVLKLGEK